MMQARKRASLVFLSWNGTVNALPGVPTPAPPDTDQWVYNWGLQPQLLANSPSCLDESTRATAEASGRYVPPIWYPGHLKGLQPDIQDNSSTIWMTRLASWSPNSVPFPYP